MTTYLKPAQDPKGLAEVLTWFSKQTDWKAAPSMDKPYAVELVKLGHLEAKASANGPWFTYRITAQGHLLIAKES